MDAKFTAGPWATHDAGRDLEIVGGGRCVARCRDLSGSDGPDSEVEANARLIAAAPDMLKALELARGYVRDELKCLLESNCLLNKETFEPDRSTLDDDAREMVEEVEKDLAVIDAAIASAKGSAE